MSFFIRNNQAKGGVKRKYNKRFENKNKNKSSSVFKEKKNVRKSVPDDNESISSDDEELAEENQNQRLPEFESESENEETAQEKRIRLAKKYLQQIEEEEKDRAQFEEGAVEKRLKDEYLEEKGYLRKTVAEHYVTHQNPIILRCKDHKDSITCLCLYSKGNILYSGSKDGSLIKWSLKEKTKLKVIKGKHKDQNGMKSVNCVTVSTDGKFLVAGDGGCKEIKVFSGESLDFIKNLQGHRDIVTGLVFRKDTHTLYSASDDRSVKVWNLDDMAYVESLFGHQNGITSIDALSRERAITSGGFDGTIRVWKIVEESQLIFNGHNNSIDIVKLINEENFFSGGNDGSLCVWGSHKKKPLCSVLGAHGKDDNNDEPNWITSIATLLNTDLVASGSKNGEIKLWRCGDSFKSLHPLFTIKVIGFINSLLFTPDGNNLIAGVGKEHRLGRWWHISEAKNCIVIIPLEQNKINK
ncbi:hypothetical protein M0802_015381 [Mischocyttarus mexicanus]|nr:hypothetical protein M0802_015381 [Mischocyttarus mexicanus]